MSRLHWAAFAPPRVAEALERQVGRTLAVHQRHVRAARENALRRRHSGLPWAPVDDDVVLRLTPLDAVVRLRLGPPRWRVVAAPTIDAPTTPLMVVNRSVTVAVRAVVRDAGGLIVEPTEPLADDDVVFWGGRPVTIERVGDDGPPTEVRDGAGRRLPVRRAVPEGPGVWRLELDGLPGAAPVRACGAVCEPSDPFAEAGPLRDGAGDAVRLLDAPGATARAAALPADGPLTGAFGRRFGWELDDSREGGHEGGGDGGRRGPRGVWVGLELPESLAADATIDPRAEFCAGDLDAVRTQPRGGDGGTIRVFAVDRETYRLRLERLPAPDDLLYAPVEVANLRRQESALFQLRHAPLAAHRGLARLCEDPARARWERFVAQPPERWFLLPADGPATDRNEDADTDEGAEMDGVPEQKAFVAKALATPDFAVASGPPGSGKTTVICELVLQFAARGERVLLVSTTHAAVDNVLERLVLHPDGPLVDAVRLGHPDRVDGALDAWRLEARIDDLLATWRARGAFADRAEDERRDMATRLVAASADLTCATTMGARRHPLLAENRADARRNGRPSVLRQAPFDVVILDEASKTTFGELLVPALLGRRWIVLGDVRQLPPFADRAEIAATLRDLRDPQGGDGGEDACLVFGEADRRAVFLRWRLDRYLRCGAGRWLVVEPRPVLDRLARELVACGPGAPDEPLVTRVGRGRGCLPVQALQGGTPAALRLLAADVVLVDDDVFAAAAPWLPVDLGFLGRGRPEDGPIWAQRHRWFRRAGRRFPGVVRDRRVELRRPAEAEDHEAGICASRDWADEAAWRLARRHELRRSAGGAHYERELDELLPRSPDLRERVNDAVVDVRDLGLASVLEALEDGVADERTQRPSALTLGLRDAAPAVFAARSGAFTHQHRMHRDLSCFPRSAFYDGEQLRDASTVDTRPDTDAWSFSDEEQLPSRRVWCHVDGRFRDGANVAEVDESLRWLGRFVAWAERTPRPDGERWSAALLTFYVRQEVALQHALARLAGATGARPRRRVGVVDVTTGTVDRFQGREADLVVLSLRNTDRTGFMDSPHRLNVALTRARHQLVVVGHKGYFAGQDFAPELRRLARATASVTPRQRIRPGRKGDTR